MVDRDPTRLAAAGRRLDVGLGPWVGRIKAVPPTGPKAGKRDVRRRLKEKGGKSGSKGGGRGGKGQAREGRTYGLQVGGGSFHPYNTPLVSAYKWPQIRLILSAHTTLLLTHTTLLFTHVTLLLTHTTHLFTHTTHQELALCDQLAAAQLQVPLCSPCV